MARALVEETQLLLTDEPLGPLDLLAREALQADFRALRGTLRFTALVLTGDVAEAPLLADRIAVLAQGRLVQVRTPQEIQDSAASADVEELLTTARRQTSAWKELLGAWRWRAASGVNAD